jgi:hypothetical protein
LTATPGFFARWRIAEWKAMLRLSRSEASRGSIPLSVRRHFPMWEWVCAGIAKNNEDKDA